MSEMTPAFCSSIRRLIDPRETSTWPAVSTTTRIGNDYVATGSITGESADSSTPLHSLTPRSNLHISTDKFYDLGPFDLGSQLDEPLNNLFLRPLNSISFSQYYDYNSAHRCSGDGLSVGLNLEQPHQPIKDPFNGQRIYGLTVHRVAHRLGNFRRHYWDPVCCRHIHRSALRHIL